MIMHTRKRNRTGDHWDAYKIGRLGIYIGNDYRSVLGVRIKGRRYVRVFWRILWRAA